MSEKLLSRKEIAQKFSLPERQSKIALMMKQEEHGLEEQVYCICKTTDVNRFMIGCDRCEEWYHGDCIDISEEEAKFIKKYFCAKCREKDPSLEIRYKQKKLEKLSSSKKEKLLKKRRDRRKDFESHEKSQQKQKVSLPGCGSCLACYRTDDCGVCETCRGMKKLGSSSKFKVCKERVCPNLEEQKAKSTVVKTEESSLVLREANYSDDDVWEPRQKKEKIQKQKSIPSKREKSGTVANHGRLHVSRKRRYTSSDEEVKIQVQVKHCYGPQCTKGAKPGSKYCSDQCGINLASARIYQILPQRIQEWNATPCIAEDTNKKELENIRKQQLEARSALEELDRKHKALDVIIGKGKSLTLDARSEDDTEDEGDETSTYCVTCGHAVQARIAVRHMERCFNKYESQTSFGSIYKTRIEGNNMFCDAYNAVNHTYCKRLRVLCPEHCKDTKVNDNEVCGCPLVKDVFKTTGELCRVAKKKCVKHHSWEKLRRAEIDLERVRQWLKLDELFEREKQIRQSMSSRAGVLGLLLHSTYNHELMQNIAAQESNAKDGTEKEKHNDMNSAEGKKRRVKDDSSTDEGDENDKGESDGKDDSSDTASTKSSSQTSACTPPHPNL